MHEVTFGNASLHPKNGLHSKDTVQLTDGPPSTFCSAHFVSKTVGWDCDLSNVMSKYKF